MEHRDFVALGIDPASTKLAAVAVYGMDYRICIKKRLGKSGGQACAQARNEITNFVGHIRATWAAPVVAYIEGPVLGRGGVKATAVQCFTSGAIQGALYEAGIPTTVANVSTWKKQVVGRGNATKPDVGEFLRLRWPSLHAAANGDQDIYDASCIALFGVQLQRNNMDGAGCL